MAPLADRVLDELGDLAALVVVDQRADLDALLGAAADLQRRASARRASRRTRRPPTRRRGSGWRRCRPRRCCASWRSSRPRPRRRGRRRRRRGTGALPPSSMDTRRICSADCSMSLRPTSVEPVKDSLRVRGSWISGAMTDARRARGDDVEHAAGQAGLLEDLRQREHRQRRLLGGLDDHRAAGRDGRADLARAHRQREVPRRDRAGTGPTGCFIVSRRPAPVGADRVAALDAHRLLGEPAQELGGVGDLGLGLGQRPCPSPAS